MSNFEQKHGEISWSETGSSFSDKTSGKDRFLRLTPGSNKMRMVTLPHQYYQHKYMPEGGNKFGYKIYCAGKDCPLCLKGDKAKRRWFVGVIDRKTDQYKILDMGYSIMKDIKTQSDDVDWGPPDQYDIDIVVDPKAGSIGYYTVVAKPKTPMSATDIMKQEENGTDELMRRSSPSTAEKVLERLANIEEEIASKGFDSSQSNDNHNNSSNDDDAAKYFKNWDTATARK
jgi:hypothetical protein